jgi:hypothetical protein
VSHVPGNFAGRRESGGTIGVIGSDLARYADFVAALTILGKPEDTRLIYTRTVDIVGNCNTICRNYRGGWVLFLGDDHTFDPTLLVNLLEHEVDVVVPLCLKRTPPFDPVVYGGQNEDGLYYAAELPEHGLTEIHAAGSAGMLVRRHVFEAIEDPWFESHGGLNEDLTFCAKVREAGFRIWCDVDTRLGHLATHQVWPAFRDGRWHADLVLDPHTTLPVKRMLKGEVPPPPEPRVKVEPGRRW